MDYEGWVHYDGCAVCPRCNKWISCEDDVPSILAAIAGHACQDLGAIHGSRHLVLHRLHPHSEQSLPAR